MEIKTMFGLTGLNVDRVKTTASFDVWCKNLSKNLIACIRGWL